MEQIESYWAGVSYTCIITGMFLMGWCFYRLAVPFMEKKKGALCVGAVYSFIMLLLYLIPFHIDNFTAYSIGVLAAFFVMCAADRRNYEQKLFLAATFFSIRWLSVAAAGIIYNILYQTAVNTSYMAEHATLQSAVYTAVRLLDLFLEFAVTAAAIHFILKAYVYKRENITKKEMFMLTIPSVTGITGYGILQYYRTFYEMDTGKGFDGAYQGLAFLHYMVSILTVVVMIVIFQNLKARREEEMQNRLLSAQMENMKSHIDKVEELYHNIRSLKHDMANHIMTLERLYTENESQEAKAYGIHLNEALQEAAGEIKSGNPVTDVILSEYSRETSQKSIAFACDFHYPAHSKINAFDVSVILNNALDNAIEAAADSKMPYIAIRSYCRKNAFLIEVSNSFSGRLEWDRESGLLVTTKGKAENHGYGLLNIRRVAQKYYGGIDIQQKGEEFLLSVMLMME